MILLGGDSLGLENVCPLKQNKIDIEYEIYPINMK